MSKKIRSLALLFALILTFSACGGGNGAVAPIETDTPVETDAPAINDTPAETPPPDASGAPSPSPKPTATATPTPAPAPVAEPLTDEELRARFAEAIESLETSVTAKVAGREWKYGAENDLKNIYYALISERPELKYAYDMTATVTDGTARCEFSYMPYKTGAYANGTPEGSHTVASLHDADVMAQSMIDGTKSLPIAITDASLDFEALQRAVAQAGYGWIAFSLSRDGTSIEATPPAGMTLKDCAERINESFAIAGEILDAIVTEDMTEREKVEAAYTYITEHTEYDHRYYSDKGSMPFESTVALGALRDGLAICGGYSHALETLLDMCGVENYTVSGRAHGEYHAWNYVVLSGVGYYCDPTADRGGMKNHLLLTEEELKALGSYEWELVFCNYG